MKILIGIIVVIVIVGGLFWFMSGDESTTPSDNRGQSQTGTEVTESSSIDSSDDVFSEIDNAMAGLE